MLFKEISAVLAAEYYYEKDPISSPKGESENSEWYGEEILKFLNIDTKYDNRVKVTHFEALLNGLHPETAEIIVPAGVNKERRAAFDFTFSAPKSVSVVALHLGDERVVNAHKNAVNKALEFIKENLMQYREVDKKKTYYIQAKNIAAANYLHTTSRANDPQLHTHSVILNIVKTSNGKCKAISNELLYQHQGLINDIYQSELAKGIKDLGYTVINYDNKFEIGGISQDVLDNFSKRSKEVEETYIKIKDDEKYKNLDKTEVMAIAALKSRDQKDYKITHDELKNIWQSEYQRENISPTKGESFTPENIINIAINEIHKSQSAFTKHELHSKVLRTCRHIGEDAAVKIINNAIYDGTIIQLTKDKGDKTYYSTKEMIRKEHTVLLKLKEGYGTMNKYIKDDRIVYPNNLTSGQKEFIDGVLTSEDKVLITQGDAGTGKTYAVKSIRDNLEKFNPNVKIVGVAFTGKAASELKEKANIETTTIASFLISEKNRDVNSNEERLIIVDEASMVSSEDMYNLLNSNNPKDRIVLIGDTKQFQSIGSGKMFKDLQEKTRKYTNMNESLRQKTSFTKKLVKIAKELHENYSNSREKNNNVYVDKIFNLMRKNKSLVEVNVSEEKNSLLRNIIKGNQLFIKNASLLKAEAVKTYLNDVNNSLLLTQSKNTKNELNKLIRAKLVEQTRITREVSINIKEIVDASNNVSSFKEKDIVVKAGKEYRIDSIDVGKNNITVIPMLKDSKSGSLKKIEINPLKESINVYREKTLSIGVGEKIMFMKNDKKIGVQNGLDGVITNIDSNNNITVKANTDSKREVTFNIKNYSYIDYGYAITIHKSQGATCKNAILYHTSKDKLSAEAFYVSSTRSQEKFVIFTEDSKGLYNGISMKQNKTSTLTMPDRKEKLAEKSKNINNINSISNIINRIRDIATGGNRIKKGSEGKKQENEFSV